MRKRLKVLISAVLVLGAVLFVLVYTRPQTIEQRYPILDLDQCVQIRGYYEDGTTAEMVPFTVQPGDARFDELVELFRTPGFKTRLSNLIPSSGTKYHVMKDGDFQWKVTFRFEEVQFPSGDVGRGDILHIDNFFGDLELRFDGKETLCSVEGQEEWAKAVKEIVIQYLD